MSTQNETQLQLIEALKEAITLQQVTIENQHKLIDMFFIGMPEEIKRKLIIELEQTKLVFIESQKKLERMLATAQDYPNYEERSN
jgi:hypothetical protein